jgi:hypothetical protein
VEELQLLGVALGLATLAGLNLYLTVFVTGLAINQQWITLSPQFQSLDVLGDPVIVTVAGILYFLEFFADKVPWIDSAWDSVHTVIRPIGGALIAIQVLGESGPTMQILAALLAGGVTLASHTTKASTRLVANTSPEPFSNIGLSLAEDAVVVGGLALIYHNPLIALAVFSLALAVFLYFAAKVFRALRAKLWLTLRKLNRPAEVNFEASLPIELHGRHLTIFSRQNVLGETIAWAVPCLSARAPRIPANLFGSLVATNEVPRKVYFVAHKFGRDVCEPIELQGYTAARDPKFLSENLLLFPSDGPGAKYLFIFDRGRAPIVEQIVEQLREGATAATTSARESQPEAEPERQPEPVGSGT